MRARRALLYTPGDDLRKIRKAAALEVDSICMDMEDGVALNRKLEASQTIAEIEMDTLSPGVRLRPGDMVIMAEPAT